MLRYKMVDIDYDDEKPTNEEIEILVKSLTPGQRLPTLTDFLCPANYTEQLIAENYLDGLLEGHKLKFMVYNLISKRKGDPYLSFDSNPRLKRIYETKCKVIIIKSRGLNLEFEYEHDIFTFDPKEDIDGDRVKAEFRKYIDSGLLLHDYRHVSM